VLLLTLGFSACDLIVGHLVDEWSWSSFDNNASAYNHLMAAKLFACFWYFFLVLCVFFFILGQLVIQLGGNGCGFCVDADAISL